MASGIGTAISVAFTQGFEGSTPPADTFLLLEDGEFYLLEDGGFILLE